MNIFHNHTGRTRQAAVLVAGLALLTNCARTFNPDIERGSTYKFRQGYPEVRLSAVGYWGAESEPHIEIVADIVQGSLFYERRGDKRVASLSVQILIFAEHENDRIISAERFPYIHEVDNIRMTESQNVFTLRRQLAVEPGRYRVQLSVMDKHNNLQTTRLAETDIPDRTNISSLTNIRLLGKELGENGNRWFPVTTYDIPGKLDSLKFLYQVYVNRNDTLDIRSNLIRFKADTTPARLMYLRDYSPSSLPYNGIDFREQEVVQRNRRVLIQSGEVTIEYLFPGLKRGNYRFEVDVDGSFNSEKYKARDFGIKSTNYPSMKTAGELARPLAYLMNDNEFATLMSNRDPDTLKQAIDRFWLKNIGNKNDAKSLIRLYYERVEEANKLFSNFKEGWKTDQGMVYILFGPPIFVTETQNRILWAYSYNPHDHGYNFTFTRPKIKSEYYPFDHFILQRNQQYYRTQYRQLQLWLTGQILLRKI